MAFGIFERLRLTPARRALLTISPAVKTSAHADGIVLLHGVTGGVFSANQTGALIWEALRRGDSLDAIGEAIARDFGVDLGTASRDTAAFVARLEREGMLVRSRAA